MRVGGVVGQGQGWMLCMVLMHRPGVTAVGNMSGYCVFRFTGNIRYLSSFLIHPPNTFRNYPDVDRA